MIVSRAYTTPFLSTWTSEIRSANIPVSLFSRPLNDKVPFNRVPTNRFIEQFFDWIADPKEGKKKERKKWRREGRWEWRKKKKTEQMIESSFSIGESCHDERHVFPLSISSDHGLRLINFHGWGNLWIDGARSQRIMTQGSRLLRRCSLTEARGQLGRNASIVSHYF